MREEQGAGVPDWLSTHPSPPDRIEATRATANAVIAEYGEKDFRLGTQDFLQRIDGIVFGENPREGFTQDGFFYHPDMRFQVEYPDDWKVINTRAAVVFLEPSQKAAVQLTLVPPDVKSPRVRAEQLSNQEGVRMLESGSRNINGHPAIIAIYQVRDYSGNSLQALAAFIDYGNNIYQLVGSAPPSSFKQYYGIFENMLTSFRELRDRKILNVQPDRIRLYKVRRGGTLRDIAKRYPNARVRIEELSVINRIGESEQLEAGTVVKVVEAGR
jgi:predicted Zn-dependent protease